MVHGWDAALWGAVVLAGSHVLVRGGSRRISGGPRTVDDGWLSSWQNTEFDF